MRCSSCGNENREGARFCDGCGATLEAASEAAAGHPAGDRDDGPSPLPPGSPDRLADRYSVTAFLGQGGRKRVYLATDEETGQEVAVAVFDTEGAAAAIGARARREAQAMGKLAGHPHVVSVYDAGEEGGDPYIVSEYMAGGDVEGMLDVQPDRRLEVARAIEIAADVARALEHAHSRGIVHRDIKPANVWLAEDGAARLGDFGLATTEGRSRVGESGTLVGTVAYLPPEQALGRTSGPRSDLYSLGALLYEMLTGKPPFGGDDAVAIIGQHINAEPVAPSRHNPQVSKALDELVGDLLAKRLEERPEGAAEVRERLLAAKGEPAVAEQELSGGEGNPLDALAGGIFVGREQEVEELRGELDAAIAGRGRVLTIVGEPGVGKTRTAEELSTYMGVRGGRVLWGRCRNEEGAPAYWPWVQAIRAYVHEADPVALAWEAGSGVPEIAQLVPELAERLGQEQQPAAAEGEEGRFRLFDAVTNFLTNAARDRPMMIVLDDLHWADEPSLLLLKFVARELGSGGGLVILGTYRDVELGRHHPLARVISELNEIECARHFTLRGLDAAAVARYIERASDIEPPPGLAEEVHARTEGNPFFVSEVVRLLVSEGNLAAAAGRGGTARVAIPQGVREVVGRRLDRLSRDANEALRVASAIGREFDEELVLRVSGMEVERLQAVAAEAIAARLVAPAGPGRYSFAHALVRETLHDELSAAQNATLHAKIAKVLEQRVVLSGGDGLGELAHHLLLAGTAGEPARAIDYASLAAGIAMEQFAYEEAAELLERALELAEISDEADLDRCLSLRLSLADAEIAGGDLGAARRVLGPAFDAARELGRTDALVEGVLQLSRTTEVGNANRQLIDLIEEALDALPERDSASRAALISTLSTEVLWIDLYRARELAEQSLEMARRAADPRTLALCLHRAVLMETQPIGTDERRVALIDELADVAGRAGATEFLLRAHAFRIRELLERGETVKLGPQIEAYANLAEEVRMPQHLWHVPLFGAVQAMIEGDLERSEQLTNEALAGGTRAGEPLAVQFTGVQFAQLRRMQGRFEELLPLLRQMTDRYPALPAWRTALASALANLGRVEEARGEFERLAVGDFESIPRDAQFMVAIALLSEVCVAVGDVERAALLYAWMLPMEGKVLVVARAASAQGPYDRILGLLAALRDERETAEAHLEQAMAIAEKTGDRPMLAWSRVDLASVLLGVVRASAGHKADPSDAERDRALALLAQAIETGREIRAGGLVERALGLRLQAQGLAGVDITTSIDEVISAVESERPDLRAHAAPDGTVTILFSDIEDSTVHTERLGDKRWLQLLRAHNAIFRERIAAHGGYEVKSQGDGFMLAFPDPLQALDCAIAVQRDFASLADEGPAQDVLRVRIGLHAGEVIAEEGDFYGKNVILAARIAALAAGGEILVSEPLKESAAEAVRAEAARDELCFDEGRELELKGLAGSHVVYRADWEAEAATA